MKKVTTKKPIAGYKALILGILAVVIMFEVLMPALEVALKLLWRFVIVPIFTSSAP